eukprot:gnl/MRDRNA2_/MRDRNA2_23345_c0_seq1.p1 gnl/MRDRNA2_/MRDRNA2_23345_c0~~gnl/MRDRNA2_/MRDRNA2_23345_c0_seq1.p1  ORF type:complete len:102 (-),score=12.06 gnl/MRDRNA2_/MRDRNA2_23345_c0_seq1:79-384(-)
MCQSSCHVGKTLRVEIVYALNRFSCQFREQLRIQLICLCKSSCQIGKVHMAEEKCAAVYRPRQRHEQLRLSMARLGKSSRCDGNVMLVSFSMKKILSCCTC